MSALAIGVGVTIGRAVGVRGADQNPLGRKPRNQCASLVAEGGWETYEVQADDGPPFRRRRGRPWRGPSNLLVSFSPAKEFPCLR